MVSMSQVMIMKPNTLDSFIISKGDNLYISKKHHRGKTSAFFLDKQL